VEVGVGAEMMRVVVIIGGGMQLGVVVGGCARGEVAEGVVGVQKWRGGWTAAAPVVRLFFCCCCCYYGVWRPTNEAATSHS
jgi:hypothetical protein